MNKKSEGLTLDQFMRDLNRCNKTADFPLGLMTLLSDQGWEESWNDDQTPREAFVEGCQE